MLYQIVLVANGRGPNSQNRTQQRPNNNRVNQRFVNPQSGQITSLQFEQVLPTEN